MIAALTPQLLADPVRADADFIVWLIIAIIVIVGKLWNKFVSMQAEEEEPASSSPKPVRQRSRPRPRPAPPAAPPVVRKASPDDFRAFMERLTRPPQPTPAATPPVARAAPPPPPPKPAEPVAATPAPERSPSGASRWAEALRDRQNLRNIIIAAEIIGPPRGA
jgi:type IV secretory pathway VirB10-like protein